MMLIRFIRSMLPVFPYMTRWGMLVAYCSLTGWLLHRCAKRTTVGSILRTLTCVPVLLGNLVVPLLFSPVDDLLTFCLLCFVVLWLASFKVAGLCINRGTLCQSMDLIQFQAALWMPITPQRITQNPLNVLGSKQGAAMPCVLSNARLDEEGGSRGQLLAGFLAKVGTLGLIVYLLGFDTPSLLTEIMYAVGLYCFLGLLMDGPATLASALIGLRIAPHFDQPYLCSSLTDFWSRRWNLTAGNALRFLVYDPISEGRLIRRAGPAPTTSRAVRRAGVIASFIVSGMVHEFIFWYIKGYVPGVSGGWLCFFSMQGPMLAVESVLRRWVRKSKREVPLWAAIPLTWAVLLAAAHLFFFPPPVQSGLADAVVSRLGETYAKLWARGQPGLKL